jgi:hypothetical protein
VIIAKWFKGRELALAMGLDISISRLASVVNGFVIPTIYNDQHLDRLGLALLVGLFVCVFSFICSIFLILLDRKADKVDKMANTSVITDEEKFRWSDIKTFNRSFWILCLSCVLLSIAIFPYI